MTRTLTPREWILLAVLAVVIIVSGYLMFFYMPMTAERDNLALEIDSTNLELETAQIQLDNKRRMERELAEIFAANPNPVGLAAYDNLQPVMQELNAVLAAADDYSLSFSSVSAEQSIVRRSINLSFSSRNYAQARQILQRLDNSAYRCMLESLNISMNQGRNSSVLVNGVIVFFEYQKV